MPSHDEERVASTKYIQDISFPGQKVDDDLVVELRQRVANLLRRNQHGFPGAQPVSFSRRHLDELRERNYYVCEKSDGIRYLLYLTCMPWGPDGSPQETLFLIDRKNMFWLISAPELHFPQKDGPELSFHTETLVDGELVMDEYPDGMKIPRFLVFDCLVLDGQHFMQRTLDKRLGYFKDMVHAPYKALLDKYPDEKSFQPFMVSMKSMQFAYGIEMMFSDILPHLNHGNDGLIFTCPATPYRFGTDPHILKWKPAEENTVDFRWRIDFPLYCMDEEIHNEGFTEPYTDYESTPQPKLYVLKGRGKGLQGENPFTAIARIQNNVYQQFAIMHLEDDEWEQLKALGDPLNNRIVEAHMDERGRWRFLRFRDDKDECNHISTVQSVMDSIADSVSKQELLEAAPAIKDRWKARKEQERQDRYRQQQARKL